MSCSGKSHLALALKRLPAPGPTPTKGPSPFPSIQSLESGLNGVTKQLKALNPNKASGPDEIPANVLKETANEIAHIIHHILQQSYTSGHLPEGWKTTFVTAIYQKKATSPTQQTIDQYRYHVSSAK